MDASRREYYVSYARQDAEHVRVEETESVDTEARRACVSYSTRCESEC